MKELTEPIINWYSKYKRDLPWRKTNNPYLIWLSEIILQQTRVDQGMDYFLKFRSQFPTVNDLANAHEDEVLKLWQGLGYYSRARNLHAAAKYISHDLNGTFPNTYKEILHLKGVGPYTAAAIASFAFGEHQAVVDGNVYRVLSRLFDVDTPIDSTSGKKEFQKIADELLPKSNPGLFNQAIMEFGALQCTPKNPNCIECPLIEKCLANKNHTITERPIKQGKTKQRNRYFYFLVLKKDSKVLIEKRDTSEIWKGLYQFPLIEKSEPTPVDDILHSEFANENISINKVSETVKHILSHQKLFAQFIHIDLSETTVNLKENSQWVSENDFHELAIPRLIDKYLEQTGSIF